MSERLSFLQPHDAEFFEREIASFLPDRVYDAHCHVWERDVAQWSGPIGEIPVVGYEQYVQLMQDIHPDRRLAAMFIPGFAGREVSARANAFAAEQVAAHPDYRGIFFIHPEDDPSWVRDEVNRLGLHGLKCYHTMSNVSPTWESPIEAFLPEAHVAMAHEEGWVITLHMVRSRGVADPGNIETIRRYCESYPGMKLILAHSARGFQPAHNLEGLERLKGLDNLYFDTSVNCEPMAHQAIIRIIGHDKLMYGTDLPVSHLRGRSVSVADTFLWLYEDTPVWGEKHQSIQPALIGLEHLRSIKWACWSERLSDAQVEDIFWNNAARLFGL
ncbi:MAG: hypothetical protein CMJ18_25255 [Phycisphaeraceae bacterium]|nr:hypothetical protein [Phycisphaeraceae bacterium]